jgi:hypothetical protein
MTGVFPCPNVAMAAIIAAVIVSSTWAYVAIQWMAVAFDRSGESK